MRILFVVLITILILGTGCKPDLPGSPEIGIEYGINDIYPGNNCFVGVVVPGTNSDFTFVIKNTGYKNDLELPGNPVVVLSGDGFSIQTQPDQTLVKPGSSTRFVLRFSPQVKATYTGSLSISSNDPYMPLFSFTITGSGFQTILPPAVSGTTPTFDRTPEWTWSTGGGGAGTYRYKLDSNDLSTGATETVQTSFTPVADLTVGSHTLYVQEKNEGNVWSASGSFAINVDGVKSPLIAGAAASVDRQPTWSWTSGGNGNGTYRYKLDDSNFSIGAAETAALSYTPAANLTPGNHTLYVQEQQDNAVYWSESGSLTIYIEPAGIPIVTGMTPTTNKQPIWTWVSGGNGTGNFRYKLNSSDLSSGATETMGTTYTPPSPLAEGSYTFYIQEQDIDGFWSESGSLTISIETIYAAAYFGGGEDGWKTSGLTSSSSNYRSFNYPEDVFIDAAGNFYLADTDNNRVSKWDANGNALGWIGGGSNGWKTTSGASSGAGYMSFNTPAGVCVDAEGNIYVADCNNHRISKWDANGNALGWIGGGSNGWQIISGTSSGTGYQSFKNPTGVCLDAGNNLYISDKFNNRISKWDANGNVLGWIGGGSNGWKTSSGASSGSGYKSFNFPYKVFVDGAGTLFISDYYNDRVCKWNADGTAQGWIGGGSDGWKTTSGTTSGSGYRYFDSPKGVFVDAAGNVYVADSSNDRVCKWDAAGNAIGWIGGGANGWQTGSGAGYSTAVNGLSYPFGVYVKSDNSLYVTGWGNRVTKWLPRE